MCNLNFHIFPIACHAIKTKDISETTYITEMLSASKMAQEVMYFLLVFVMFFNQWTDPLKLLTLITFPSRLAPSLCEQICLLSTDVTYGWRKLGYVTHSVARVISHSRMSLLLTLLHGLSPTIPPPPPFFCHFAANIPLWCAPSLLYLSIPGVQLRRPRGAGFSCGNEWGHPEGGSAHRFRDPAAGGCLCHRDLVHSPGHPLYRARQPGWEVTCWDT